MAQKRIKRKHFLISAGIAVLGLTGWRSRGEDASTVPAKMAADAARLVQPEPRAVPRNEQLS